MNSDNLREPQGEFAGFAATFADWRTVKSRKVLQLVFEIPLEQQAQVLTILGAPLPHEEKWCAIGLLNSPAGKTGLSSVSQKGDTISAATGDHGTPNPKPTGEHHKRSWYELPASQRAALLCSDGRFQKWTTQENPCEDNSKKFLYWTCGIHSRAELTTNDNARAEFEKIEREYRLWAGLETEERS